MTTPAGGGNEIEFITRLIAAGDEAAVLREIGERGYQGLVEALSRRGIQLPQLETGEFEASFAGVMARLQERSLSASQQMAAGWREAYAQMTQGLGTEAEVAQERQLQAILAQRRALQTYAPNLQASAYETYSPNIEASLQREIELRQQDIRAIEEMTVAERNLAVAEARLAAATESGNKVAMLTATNRLTAARQAVEQEESLARRANSPSGGFFGNFFGGFTTGKGLFHNAENGENAFARTGGESGEFLGAIARYQAAYALIFGISRGFSALVQAQSSADDQMIEFADATGLANDKAQALASNLNELVAAAGGSVATALQTATRGIFAFGDQIPRNAQNQPTQGQGQAIAENIGRASAQAAAMAQLLTGAQDIGQVQGQLIATTRDFNLQATEQVRVLDAAANAGRNYGASIADILEGLPNVSIEAHAAGLSIEQTANMMALAISRSGGSGTAIASTFTRALADLDKPEVRAQLAGEGVNTSGLSGQVLENLAQRWNRLSASQQAATITALGGGRAIRSLLPILQEGSHLLDADQQSYNRAGYATELYYARLNTLGGLLRTLRGDLGQFAYDLERTGAINLFGGALAGLNEVVRGVDDLLKVFDLLPQGVRSWLLPLGEVLAVMTLIGRQMARNEAIQAATTAETDAQAAGQTVGGLSGFFSRLRGRGGVGGALSTEQEAAAGGVGLGRAFGALGAALLGPAGVVVGAIALTAAIGGTIDALHNEDRARKQASDALTSVQGARSAEQFRAAASQLGDAIAELKHAQSGFFGGLFNDNTSQIANLEGQRAFAQQMASEIEAEQRRVAGSGTSPLGAFFSNTGSFATDIANGITSMTQAGVPAVRQLQLLTQAIRATGDAASGASHLPGSTALATPGAYGTKEFVGAAVEGVTAALANRLKSVTPDDFASVYNAVYGGPQPPAGTDQRTIDEVHRQRRQQALTPQALADQLGEIGVLQDPAAIKAALEAGMSSLHIGPNTLLTPDLERKLANFIITNLGISSEFVGKARTDLQNAIINALSATATTQANQPIPQLKDQDSFNQFITGLDKNGKATGAGSLAQYLQGLAQFDDPRQLDPSLGRLQATVTYLSTLAQQAQSRGLGGFALEELLQLLHQSQHDLTLAAIAQMERLRKAAEAGDTSPASVAATERSYVEQEVRTALRAHDMSALVQVLDSADKATIDAVESAIKLQYNTALDSYNHAMAVYNAAVEAWRQMPAGLKNANPELAPVAPSDAGVKSAKRAVDLLNQANKSVVPGSGSGSGDANALAQAQILAGARAGDPVSEARANLAAAQYARDHAKNQTDYWNAVKQVNDAQRQLTEAIAGYHEAEATGEHYHPGNAVANAAAAVKSATDALNASLTGTADWWNNYKALQDAMYAQTQVIEEHQHQVNLARIDQTDPVAVAREELRAARQKEADDRKNHTGDPAADMAAEHAANARYQAALFDQQLHDVQVAHDLGQLSDAAYIRYLDNQHDRLTAIKHKTRQQIDELQQIDEALKAAADQMQGQWNIGDIKIPTPYEARRYIETASAGLTYSGATQVTQNVTNNDVKVNGADTAAVRAILIALLGPSVVQTISTKPRKV